MLTVRYVLYDSKSGHGDKYIPRPTVLLGHVSNTHKHQCILHNHPQSMYDAQLTKTENQLQALFSGPNAAPSKSSNIPLYKNYFPSICISA